MTAQARIIVAIVALSTIALGATAGFMLIEGWSLGESIYMAVITVSTVGYGEVRPLTANGRALAVAVILLAVATLGYSATAIGAYLADGHLVHDFRRRRMERAIRRLRDHYVICGGGRFGREVAEEFSRSRAPSWWWNWIRRSALSPRSRMPCSCGETRATTRRCRPPASSAPPDWCRRCRKTTPTCSWC